MPITYKDFWGELISQVPKLSNFQAQRFVNRAWKDIRDSRQWSFLKTEGILFSPAVITTGVFNVTRFSNVVTASAAAITALNNLNNPLLTKRQIRFGSGATPVYNIAVVDAGFAGNGLLYLDRPYKEPSNSAVGYRVYRCYYGGPEVTTVAVDGTATTTETTDLLRFNDIYNPTNARSFVGLNLPRELLDRRDPQRAIVGNIPYYLFAYKSDSNNNPLYEMWPHPTAAQAYLCSYQRRGIDFASDTETLPSAIPDDLLMERALFYACAWAAKNAAKYKELVGVNWKLEQAAHRKEYSTISSASPGLLEIAQRNDEELYPQSVIQVNNSYRLALGSDDVSVYYQSNGILTG
jgi:hypothetical protein